MEIPSSQPTQIYDTKAIRFQSVYELKQLLKYRFLVQNLVSRDLKVRYKRSALGLIWVMLNPLLTMTVTVYVFANILQVKVLHFPTYALAGLLLFNLFSQGSMAAMSNLTSNGPILNRIYLPPSVYVISSVNSALVNFMYALVPLAIITIGIDHIIPSLYWILAIIPVSEMVLFTGGIGLIVSALMVYFRDVFEIYSVIVSILSFITPIFYTLSIHGIPLQVITFEQFNPIYVFIDTLRSILIYYRLPNTNELLTGALFAVLTSVIGWFIFTRLERGFAYQF